MAAVPEPLVESELFGHAKGSFTGASDSRTGKFEAASGGTLFIDEIGDFALPSQAKLLRVLENHRVTPVGSNEERGVDVRVVAATSRDLNNLVAQGRFRADLYFRLDVIHLHLPPLRERQAGIPLLINHFLAELSESLERPVPAIEPDVMEFLVHHDWPGNVRQLKNCLESMFVLSDGGMLRMEDVPESAKAHPPPTRMEIPSGVALYELERTAIENALREHDGNRTHAAKALRISVRTLQRKLKEVGEVGFARP
jgi:transcriptional regulator with PAS, ATPase and Fis domain